MHRNVFRIIWPYLLRFLAKYAAEYLQKRREWRKPQGKESPESLSAEQIHEAQSAAAESIDSLPAQTGLLSANAFWYTLAGVLLGSALSIIVAQIMGQDED